MEIAEPNGGTAYRAYQSSIALLPLEPLDFNAGKVGEANRVQGFVSSMCLTLSVFVNAVVASPWTENDWPLRSIKRRSVRRELIGGIGSSPEARGSAGAGTTRSEREFSASARSSQPA